MCLDDVVYNQSCNAASTLDKRRPDLRDELGYIAPPNRKLPPVPGSNYNTCDRIKRGTISKIAYRFFDSHAVLFLKHYLSAVVMCRVRWLTRKLSISNKCSIFWSIKSDIRFHHILCSDWQYVYEHLENL